MTRGTRAEHLAWCKARALQYVDAGEPSQAFSSFVADLRKHPETDGHAAIELGGMLLFDGHLSSPTEMRKFIEGAS